MYKAQALLRAYFTADPGDYLFSPAKATAEFHAARSANRKTPLYASHAARNAAQRKAAPTRRPAAKYTVTAYEHAVARVCERALPPPAPLAGEPRARWRARLSAAEWDAVQRWHREHRWHPNQLRHAFATRVRAEYDLEAAQVLLGHARADVTQVYAEKNTARVTEIAAEIG